MEVELVWQRDCPNAAAARRNLMRAFSAAGVPARWREWCVDDPGCPERARAFGSPSVLVNGLDVAGRGAAGGPSCRLYRAEGGALVGAPPTDVIAAALREAPGGDRFSWRRLAAAAPAFGVALLPKIACPAYWPAYAGVLGSLGVSFLIDARYLFALTATFLAVALFFLGFRASRRRGYAPLALGLVASVLLLIGKFHLESDPAMFGGVGLLMIASLWNSWPRSLATSPERSALAPSAPVGPCCGAATPKPPAARRAPGSSGELS